MTTIHRQPARQRGTTEAPVLAPIALAWDVLGNAPGVAALLGPGPAPAQVRLVIRIEGRRAGVFIEWEGAGRTGPERRAVRDSLPVSIEAVGDEGLTHVEVAGILRATLLAPPAGAPRVIYARTTLLASLGFPGGSYDRPGAWWECR